MADSRDLPPGGSRLRDDERYRCGRWEHELPSRDELVPLNQTLITPILARAFSIKDAGVRAGRSEADAYNAAQATLSSLYEGSNWSEMKVDYLPASPYPAYSTMASGGPKPYFPRHPYAGHGYGLPAGNGSQYPQPYDMRGQPPPYLQYRNSYPVSYSESRDPRSLGDSRYALEARYRTDPGGPLPDARYHDQRIAEMRYGGNPRLFMEPPHFSDLRQHGEPRGYGDPALPDPRYGMDLRADVRGESRGGANGDWRGAERPKSGARSPGRDFHRLVGGDGRVQPEARPSGDAFGESMEGGLEARDLLPRSNFASFDRRTSGDLSDSFEGSKGTGGGQGSSKKARRSQDGGEEDDGEDSTGGRENSGDEQQPKTLKRPRLVWTPQLHKRFVDAVGHLGIKNAVPKTIMQLMNVEGLTRENVASHLQKYRLYLKRMQGLSNDGPSPSDRLFSSTPVPPSLSSPPQVHYMQGQREEPVRGLVGPMPYASHGQALSHHAGYPQEAMGPPVGHLYAAYDPHPYGRHPGLAHPMASRAPVQGMHDFMGEAKGGPGQPGTPSSPPQRVLRLFPSSGN